MRRVGLFEPLRHLVHTAARPGLDECALPLLCFCWLGGLVSLIGGRTGWSARKSSALPAATAPSRSAPDSTLSPLVDWFSPDNERDSQLSVAGNCWQGMQPFSNTLDDD